MHVHHKDSSEKAQWKGSTQGRSFLTDLRRAIRNVLRSSEILPSPTSISRRASGTSIGRPSLVSLSSPSLPALPSLSTVRFVLLCGLWYASSALSSNTGKAIMIQFRYPVTLTFVQFGFVAAYCLLFMSPVSRFTRLRRPTRAILKDTLPMGCFQVGGHIFSSMAISRIPVSTTHTIKALSPLFTVAAYALLFGVRYSAKTYISLLPLTLGVMLACSFDISASNSVGLLCAFGSAIVFVSSNIFFKRIMPTGSSSSHHKLDKLNLLFYSSSMAFLLMIPIWVFTDLPLLMAARATEPGHITHPAHGHTATHSVTYYTLLNGIVHFAQNIIAFVILASVSPVTYSIASLFKRVAVICIALVWFNQRVHPIQGIGIALTFLGLWMYNNAKGDIARGETRRRGVEAVRDGALPLTRSEESILNSVANSLPPPAYERPTAAANLAVSSARPQDALASPLRSKTHVPLHIDITAPPHKGSMPLSPPYPSPPASLDSPPLTAALTTAPGRA
ncbi:triose-phosphate transporter family-domain-containing protein [Multifurca ochricompacta]|uniref:Triose-phosphate transporter family-domain-containing protein n=1 Tax=Multifurca ochricompacta TaxID=376703 RepID=A0AAD4QRK3_9AGAM|nr:triose-phosphate transporter family-domain-containing protein [Multifurca ochricompacta]